MINNKYNVTVLHFGRAGANGKVYDASDFKVEQVVPVMAEKTNARGMIFMDQVGTVKLTKNNITLEADITIQAEHGERVSALLESGFKFAACGRGHVDDGGYIRGYMIAQIILTNKPANIY